MIDRINEITNVTNNIIRMAKANEGLKNEIVINIKNKLDLIKEEIVNVDYALHWAKAGIVNSFILSNSELNIVKELFEKNNVPYLNLEEAIDFAEIKIASSNSTLLYIVSIPNTEIKNCKTLLIKPVKRGNLITKITHENLLQCENKLYAIKEKCVTSNKLTICKNRQIIDLGQSSCIADLLTSRPPNCTEIDGSHIPATEEIFPGTLLLNQFSGTIHIDGEALNLTGTFIIQHHNATLTVNKQLYLSKEISSTKPLPPIMQPDPSFRTFEETLTLHSMKELHLNNTGRIELIEEESRIGYSTSLGLTSIIIILLITTTILNLIKRYRAKASSTASAVESIIIAPTISPATENQGSTSTLAETPRISQIPYF